MTSTRPPTTVTELADRLFTAFETATPIAPLTEADPRMDVSLAYDVQRVLLERHRAVGRSLAGRKIGLTSVAMQRQLNVSEPDFGFILDSHVYDHGATLSVSECRMIAPRLEAELAFVLGRDLAGPGISEADVMSSAREIVPVFEIIDSRICDWRIRLPDTIADNASCYGAVRGTGTDPSGIDLSTVGLVLERDGEQLATAAGAAVMGHPARAVAWLANTLGGFGDTLEAGALVLSGSFTAAVEAEPGTYTARFGEGLGTVEVTIDG